jgi:cell shape-determining protein MreC
VIKYQNITVPAKGRGGGNFEIHIPREIEVSDGDILVFPYDPTIAVGIVKSIEFDPRDPFQKILARTPVNIQELRFVEVVE